MFLSPLLGVGWVVKFVISCVRFFSKCGVFMWVIQTCCVNCTLVGDLFGCKNISKLPLTHSLFNSVLLNICVHTHNTKYVSNIDN